MKKLVQKRATQEFLMPDGSWSKNLEEALEIKSEDQVRTVLEGLAVNEDVVLYYAFDSESRGRDWDFTIPI